MPERIGRYRIVQSSPAAVAGERRGQPSGRKAQAMSHDSTFLFPDTDPDTEPHAASPTAHLLDELALYGHRPHQDEPDARPLPACP